MVLARAMSLVVGVILSTSALGASDSPVKIWRGVSKLAPVNPDRIVHADANSLVFKTAEAQEADFENVYVVNLHNWFAEPEWIFEYGEVLAFEPARYAVMRLLPGKVEELSSRLHGLGLACGVLTRLYGDAVELELAATPNPILPVNVRDARVINFVSKVTADNIRSNIEFLSALHTRYHTSSTGQQVADLLAEKYETLRVGRADVSINTFSHGSRTPQKSLIVRIEGRTRPNEVIILGSHLDSVAGFGGTSRSPGVDDNASGTATNLEIFRILMEEGIILERTLEIHAYAAEEIGLVGSQDIATKYKNDGINVVAMVQHDMTLWKAPGAEDKIWFVTSNTDSGFNGMLAQLVDGYVGLPWGSAALSGGSSDHASWRRAGFPTAFPFENPQSYNRHIHTSNDTLDNANAFNQAAGFAKLGLSYVSHFGGLH